VEIGLVGRLVAGNESVSHLPGEEDEEGNRERGEEDRPERSPGLAAFPSQPPVEEKRRAEEEADRAEVGGEADEGTEGEVTSRGRQRPHPAPQEQREEDGHHPRHVGHGLGREIPEAG
jgi:hypothetical protein